MPFSKEELSAFATKWIGNFGHLSELVAIRHVLQELVAEMRDLRDQLHDDLEILGVRLARIQ